MFKRSSVELIIYISIYNYLFIAALNTSWVATTIVFRVEISRLTVDTLSGTISSPNGTRGFSSVYNYCVLILACRRRRSSFKTSHDCHRPHNH